MRGMNFSAPLDAVITGMRKTGKKVTDTIKSGVAKYKAADAAWQASPEAQKAKKKIQYEG